MALLLNNACIYFLILLYFDFEEELLNQIRVNSSHEIVSK